MKAYVTGLWQRRLKMSDKNLADFSKEQFYIKYEKIQKELTAGCSPVSKPYATILGGQPGAGKSFLHNKALSEDNNIILINGDDYRKYHPNFKAIDKTFSKDSPKYTQTFANTVVERLISDLSDGKFNLSIEGTLRTAEVPLKTCRILKEKGYIVELSVMAVSKELSWQGTISRYKEMESLGMIPRTTSRENHDYIVKVIPENLHEIFRSGEFHRITLYDRALNCLYDSKITPDLSPQAIILAALQEKD